MRSYVRFAALGDSTTAGIGDPVAQGWRGWARLLADAMATTHDVSLCNVAVSGATGTEVVAEQLAPALSHRPTVASLIVGINDTMRSNWDPVRLREEIETCAESLHRQGALLLTTRFHDHGAVFGLPQVVRRPLWRRIEAVNAIYADVESAYGGIQLDLAAAPEVYDRAFWSVDRLHPSELGHRTLARCFGARLNEAGLRFDLPAATTDGGCPPTWRSDVAWMVTEGAPWLGRRARDLGPWLVRNALAERRSDERWPDERWPDEGRLADR